MVGWLKSAGGRSMDGVSTATVFTLGTNSAKLSRQESQCDHTPTGSLTALSLGSRAEVVGSEGLISAYPRH